MQLTSQPIQRKKGRETKTQCSLEWTMPCLLPVQFQFSVWFARKAHWELKLRQVYRNPGFVHLRKRCFFFSLSHMVIKSIIFSVVCETRGVFYSPKPHWKLKLKQIEYMCIYICHIYSFSRAEVRHDGSYWCCSCLRGGDSPHLPNSWRWAALSVTFDCCE